MTSVVRRRVSAAIVLALVLSLMPSVAAAAPRQRLGRTARARSLAVGTLSVRPAFLPGLAPPTWARDAYDQASEDDTPGGARDLTAYVAGDGAPNGFGMPAYEEAHTFYVASNESTPGDADYEGDQDWFRFDVSDGDVLIAKRYTIEAHVGNAWVDPVIEVYGPTTVGAIAPSDPAASVDSSGYGLIDELAANAGDYEADDGWWYVGGYSPSASFGPSVPGTYFFRVRPKFDGSGAYYDPPLVDGYNALDAGAGPYTLRFKAGVITRLAGNTRVNTAIALSKERYADGELPLFDSSLVDATGTVVVANGYNFPDALAGSTLAGAVSGPLLLTHPDLLDAEVRAEIIRLGAHRVLILGSTSALTDGVKRALEGIPGVGVGNVVRVQGSNRVKTAVEVAKRANLEYGVAPVAFVANGYSFPDALAASPMAAYNVAPILLTHKDFLDGDTLAAFDQLGTTDVIILGGTAAVGPAVESRLKSRFGQSHVRRVGGANRYETAKLFAVWATGDRGTIDAVGASGTLEENKLYPLDWTRFCVAAGWNYPDALGGGAFAGLAGYPLLLNPEGEDISPWILDIQEVLPAGSSFLSFDPGPGFVYDVGRSYVLGGPSAVGDGVLGGLDNLAGVSP